MKGVWPIAHPHPSLLSRAGPRGARIAGLLALSLALVAAPWVLSTFLIYLLIEMLILSLFATSLNILIGYGGMISLGHGAYFGLGAYTAALLVKRAGWGMPWAFAVSPFAAALGALVFGFFCVRLTRAYFLMLTLAFAQLLYAVIFKWYDLTGGENGLSGVWPTGLLATPQRYFYFTLLVVTLSSAAIHRVIFSPFGYALRAIRENPLKAEFVGIPVRRHQLIAFVIAGFFAGIAGALFAFFNGSVFPDLAFWTKSAEPLIAVIIGGQYSFWGPMLGAVVFEGLEIVITRLLEYWQLVLGCLVLLMVLAFPQGLTGVRRGLWRRRREA